LADSTFGHAHYFGRLGTRRLGRILLVRGEVDSTNDVAWEAHERGVPDGIAVVADAQHRGRGRAGRAWHMAPGKGLALSLLVRRAGQPIGLLPLLSGLALARALERLGIQARLKWPNDLLLGRGKVAGILAEARGDEAIVVGVGVNIDQGEDDFPPGLVSAAASRRATSLAIEGFQARREIVAAEFANAFEPLWIDLEARGAEPLLEAWTRRASFWGEALRAETPAGAVAGIARALDPSGGLVLELPGGRRITVVAGDVVPSEAPATTDR
jgi:BirA family biotin operon repressor/biotin-[acetyl-CoA-carboxylase] ligase